MAFPTDLLADIRLPDHAVRVAVALWRLADSDGYCRASYEEIASASGKANAQAVKRAVKALEVAGYVARKRIRGSWVVSTGHPATPQGSPQDGSPDDRSSHDRSPGDPSGVTARPLMGHRATLEGSPRDPCPAAALGGKGGAVNSTLAAAASPKLDPTRTAYVANIEAQTAAANAAKPIGGETIKAKLDAIREIYSEGLEHEQRLRVLSSELSFGRRDDKDENRRQLERLWATESADVEAVWRWRLEQVAAGSIDPRFAAGTFNGSGAAAYRRALTEMRSGPSMAGIRHKNGAFTPAAPPGKLERMQARAWKPEGS